MSSPQLVATIRRLTKEVTTHRLLHDGAEPVSAITLRSALAEAKKRNITIQHPELT